MQWDPKKLVPIVVMAIIALAVSILSFQYVNDTNYEEIINKHTQMGNKNQSLASSVIQIIENENPGEDPEPLPTMVPEPSPEPNPVLQPSPTPEPSTTPTPTPTVTPTPTEPRPTNQPEPRPTSQPTPRPTNPPIITPVPTQQPTGTPTPTPTQTPTATPTPTPTATPTPTPTPEPSPTPTPEPDEKEKKLHMAFRTQVGDTETWNPMSFSPRNQTIAQNGCSFCTANMIETTFTGAAEVDRDYMLTLARAHGCYYEYADVATVDSWIAQNTEGHFAWSYFPDVLHYEASGEIATTDPETAWNTAKSAIDAGNPLVLFCKGKWDSTHGAGELHRSSGPHFMAIKGYGTDDNGLRYLIVNDPGKTQGEERHFPVDDFDGSHGLTMRVCTARDPLYDLKQCDCGHWHKVPFGGEDTPPEPEPTPEPTPEPAPQPVSGDFGAELWQAALAYHGKGYSQGSYSDAYPEDSGRPRTGPDYFDCSGLVWKVLKDCGFYVPESAWGSSTAESANGLLNQEYYMKVTDGNLQPGDVGVRSGHMQFYFGAYAVDLAKQEGLSTPEQRTCYASRGHDYNTEHNGGKPNHSVCVQKPSCTSWYRPIKKAH